MKRFSPAIHQFLPTLSSRDAIGAHTLAVRELLQELGWESEIYAWEITAGLEGRARSWRSFRWPWRRSGTWLLYQASIASFMADFLRERPEPKLVNYHNITPYELVAPWDKATGEAVLFGRQQLRRLAPLTELAVAVSRFNQADLEQAGFIRTSVVPPLIDQTFLEASPDRAMETLLLRAKDGGGADWLFVGRIAAHKAQHRLVAALAAYRRAVDPKARLHLVGTAASDSYSSALERYIAELGLAGAVELHGSVTPQELVALYRNADLFVCLSEHEGFCIPLVEAMYHRVPVVAYAAGAVPETVGSAGVLIAQSRPLAVVAAAVTVAEDASLRAQLAQAAEARCAELHPARVRLQLAFELERVVGRP